MTPLIDACIVGLLGGLVNYFWYIQKNSLPFGFKSFFTTALLAAFTGLLGYFFIPEGPDKPGYLMLAGFFCHKIIETIEKRWDAIVKAVRRP